MLCNTHLEDEGLYPSRPPACSHLVWKPWMRSMLGSLGFRASLEFCRVYQPRDLSVFRLVGKPWASGGFSLHPSGRGFRSVQHLPPMRPRNSAAKGRHMKAQRTAINPHVPAHGRLPESRRAEHLHDHDVCRVCSYSFCLQVRQEGGSHECHLGSPGILNACCAGRQPLQPMGLISALRCVLRLSVRIFLSFPFHLSHLFGQTQTAASSARPFCSPALSCQFRPR